MKKIIGDKGLQAHWEIPANHISIHWLLMLILIISLIAGIVAVYVVIITERQEDSFERFIRAEKAGVYQGVTMSPKINTNTYKHNGEWIVEIAGAGSEGKVKTWEGK